MDFGSTNGNSISCRGRVVSVLSKVKLLSCSIAHIMPRAPLISDPLQYQLLGRRGAIAIACLLSIAATVGQSFSKSPAQLAGCRVITGLTLAAKASIAPLLVAEISPDHLRGKKYYLNARETID